MHETTHDEQFAESAGTDLGSVYEQLQALNIQLARLYDMQMAMLKEVNPDIARQIAEFHNTGGLLSPGVFYDPEATIESLQE